MAEEIWHSTVRSVRDRESSSFFLIALLDGGVVTHALPDSGEVTIGRAEQCNVVIGHPSISRQHAMLRLSEPFAVSDLGSSNGTTVRDKQIPANTPTEISPNEAIQLGDVTVVLQRRPKALRSRRLWGHDYFEGRVAEECARVMKTGSSFSVVHLSLSRDIDPAVLQDVLADHLEELEVLGRFGPKDYEVLVADPARAELLSRRLPSGFAARSIDVRVGYASCPQDGRDADKLLGRARSASVALVTGPRARGVILEDDVMRNLYQLAERISVGMINVLILGETGVGKQVLAEAIHKYSPRRERPFVELNCSAFSETLLESELFGHEKGAFTGADKAKTGLLESANGGTVFLDEIGDMALSLQAKLLRALENQEVLAVGSLKARRIDVRFVAATNRDLEQEVRAGRFRQDLFFRINGVTLQVPPLRERTREIAALAKSFVADYVQALGLGRTIEISQPAMAMLTSYSWPGNIRELRNVMERATLLCSGDSIGLEHLPVEKMHATFSTQAALPASMVRRDAEKHPAGTPPPVAIAPLSGDETDEEKKQRVWEALMACGGNNTEAARLLGVSRRTLGKWLEAFGLPRPRKARATEVPE